MQTITFIIFYKKRCLLNTCNNLVRSFASFSLITNLTKTVCTTMTTQQTYRVAESFLSFLFTGK